VLDRTWPTLHAPRSSIDSVVRSCIDHGQQQCRPKQHHTLSRSYGRACNARFDPRSPPCLLFPVASSRAGRCHQPISSASRWGSSVFSDRAYGAGPAVVGYGWLTDHHLLLKSWLKSPVHRNGHDHETGTGCRGQHIVRCAYLASWIGEGILAGAGARGSRLPRQCCETVQVACSSSQRWARACTSYSSSSSCPSSCAWRICMHFLDPWVNRCNLLPLPIELFSYFPQKNQDLLSNNARSIREKQKRMSVPTLCNTTRPAPHRRDKRRRIGRL
jgi:hypothetical protein